MAVLIASDLAKDVAGAPLLRGVSLKLERGTRLTVAGRNGAGKTTLLRMLAGEVPVDGGELVLQKGARVALHDQRPPRHSEVSLRDYVLGGCQELIELELELERLEHRMASGDQSVFDAYARAQSRLEHAGGYHWRERALSMVRGLGFGDADLDRGLATFSGGELTRGSLARALAADPDLLLLDEPTNHLDIDSLEWLEQTLTALDAAVVLVAHDRWFLEAVGTAVLELEGGRGRFFPGSWHAWRKESAARELALGRAIERQQAEIARLERFVTRFRAGTRARQAQSRAKRLAKIDRLEGTARDGRGLQFAFEPPSRTGRVVFELEQARVAVDGRTLIEGADLWLERGEHVSLVGPNGSGKTTLVDVIVGGRPPASGRLRRGHNVKVGYLSQSEHADDLEAHGPRSVLEATHKQTGLTPNRARALLGRFLFSGEDADKPLAALSGGERRRLSLALLVHSGANVLVLDEPTNHLDLESREALEDALRAFEGSLLLVSHDRALLDAVGSRTVAIEDGALRTYVGGWAEYARVREQRKAAGRAPEQSGPRSRGPARRGREQENGSGREATGSGAAPALSKNAQRRLAELEREIEAAERDLALLEDELADPAAWSDPARAAQSAARHEEARRNVDTLYARLEAL
ncbi:MAG TPA: ABC-F family ATP-binding cassette domain-containing protein [Solirubrobacteraceae bacterium]|nr:ABC-F family ATP-binding cassette domain-containing protein [Solirubrobacteraceae bacterium]